MQRLLPIYGQMSGFVRDKNHEEKSKKPRKARFSRLKKYFNFF
jgi:hypothetical protein